jgi:hypothetical protein
LALETPSPFMPGHSFALRRILSKVKLHKRNVSIALNIRYSEKGPYVYATMSIRQIHHGVACTLTRILTAGKQKGERLQTHFSVTVKLSTPTQAFKIRANYRFLSNTGGD